MYNKFVQKQKKIKNPTVNYLYMFVTWNELIILKTRVNSDYMKILRSRMMHKTDT